MVPETRLREEKVNARMQTWIRTLAFSALAIALCGCANARSKPVITAEVREAIYARANVEFTNAVLWKPSESSDVSSNDFRLAPIILEEAGVRQDVPDTNKPVRVSVCSYETTIAGRSREQWIFLCRFPAPSPDVRTPMRAVKITLDRAGQPVIWEILGDSTGADVIFVSQSLETAAAGAFGGPLPGRRYSVERDLAAASNTVVARVIEDGPMPMGPMIYVGQGYDLITLICRCMPAQARELVGQRTYRLEEATLPWPRPPLERRLRLPPGF